jgi:hypothetical protein
MSWVCSSGRGDKNMQDLVAHLVDKADRRITFTVYGL